MISYGHSLHRYEDKHYFCCTIPDQHVVNLLSSHQDKQDDHNNIGRH